MKALSVYGVKVAELGKGTYGSVNKYSDSYGNEFAIKTLIIESGRVRRSAIREVSLMLRSNFPTILNAIDVLHIGNTLNIVLELAKGDLQSLIAYGGNYGRTMAELANAISYLHSIDVIHRDIKPANVLVMKDDSIKLGDFGMSHPIGCRYSDSMTDMIGTITYMSPEILLYDHYPYSRPVDVWAFACVCFYIYYRKSLFISPEGDTRDQRRNMMIQRHIDFLGSPDWYLAKQSKRINTQIPRQSSITLQNISVPPVLLRILKSVLIWNPDKRVTIDTILSYKEMSSSLNTPRTIERPCSTTSLYPQFLVARPAISYMLLAKCYYSNIGSKAFQLASFIVDSYGKTDRLLEYYLTALQITHNLYDAVKVRGVVYLLYGDKNGDISDANKALQERITNMEIPLLESVNYNIIQTLANDYIEGDVKREGPPFLVQRLCDFAYLTDYCNKYTSKEIYRHMQLLVESYYDYSLKPLVKIGNTKLLLEHLKTLESLTRTQSTNLLYNTPYFDFDFRKTIRELIDLF